MATAQPAKRKRDPPEHADLDPTRPSPNGAIHESKKRQRSPEKLDREPDHPKRPRRDDERREERRESERHGGGDRDRRNGERHDREGRDRDGDRSERGGRGEGRYDRDKRDGDRRHGDRRDADRKDRARDGHNSNRRSPIPPSTAKPSSSKPLTPSGSSAAVQPEVKQELLDPEDEETAQMKKLMGFASFKSTKNTKVPGNDKLYGVRKEKKTEYRQYMNRVGGFNRPLSPSR